MNPIERRLLGLVEIAETPLYSAYRWLGRDLGGGDLSMPGFLQLVERLVECNVVQLWRIDLDTHERQRMTSLPSGLAARYATISDLDDGYDPFAMSLTVGPSAESREDPAWECDLDFSARRFVIRARAEAVAEAHTQLSCLWGSVTFHEQRRMEDGSQVRIEGVLGHA
jgi:hypothetical protein